MFVNAINKVSEFTRPIHTITRQYGSEVVIPGAATMFFVNEEGVAITCKHVATIIAQSEAVKAQYINFKNERDALPSSNKYKRKLKELEKKYQYNKDITVEIKNLFVNCVDTFKGFEIIVHPTYDVAIIKFNGYGKLSYTDYAKFLTDDNSIQQGKQLCRLGYPFPEFSNFRYDAKNDEIEWTQEGQGGTPRFPIDGMITRSMQNENETFGIEISTPGLKGQSGGPLFDEDGKIYGMQSATHHLHLGFDIKDYEILDGGRKRKVSNYPFLHLGQCVHLNIIKAFLKDNGIKYYEE